MSRVLVTGGAGFIGSHVVDRLRAAGHEPRIFDLRPSPHHPPKAIDTVIGDIRDARALRRAMEGCEAVAHLAAVADVDVVTEDPAAAEELNSRGTLNVLEAARAAGVERVVYASTIWVYSDVEATAVDESTPLLPPAHLYTATKLAGELYCRSYAELYGLEYTILRFGIPYGPRARPAAVVPAFVGRALAGEALTVAGDGSQSRRFVYVEDLAEGVVRGLEPVAANRTFNLVGDEDVSIREIAATVCELVGDVAVEQVPGRAGDFGGVEVSGERASRELDWRPSTDFREGVRRYIAWHREQAPAEPRPELAGRRTLVRHALRVAAMLAAILSVVGVIAAGLAAVGSLEELTEQTRTVVTALLLLLPLLLAGGLDWDPLQRRAVATLCWVLAVADLAALLVPWPPGVAHLAKSHWQLFLLAALSAGWAGGLAATGRSLALRERPSDSGA